MPSGMPRSCISVWHCCCARAAPTEEVFRRDAADVGCPQSVRLNLLITVIRGPAKALYSQLVLTNWNDQKNNNVSHLTPVFPHQSCTACATHHSHGVSHSYEGDLDVCGVITSSLRTHSPACGNSPSLFLLLLFYLTSVVRSNLRFLAFSYCSLGPHEHITTRF